MTRYLVTRRIAQLRCTVVLLCLFGAIPDGLSLRFAPPRPSAPPPWACAPIASRSAPPSASDRD